MEATGPISRPNQFYWSKRRDWDQLDRPERTGDWSKSGIYRGERRDGFNWTINWANGRSIGLESTGERHWRSAQIGGEIRRLTKLTAGVNPDSLEQIGKQRHKFPSHYCSRNSDRTILHFRQM